MKTYSLCIMMLLLAKITLNIDLYLVASNNNQINRLIKRLPSKSPFVMDFSANRISWNICNQYGGDFTYNKATSTIKFGYLISTLIFCTGVTGRLERLVASFFDTQPMRYHRLYDDNVHYLINSSGNWLMFINSLVVN